MNFNLKPTKIYQEVKTAKAFPPKLVKLISWLLLIISLVLLADLLADGTFLGLSSTSQVLGLFLIILSFDILIWAWLIFFETVFKPNTYLDLPLKEAITFSETNLAEYLDFDIANNLIDAMVFCNRKKIPLTSIYLILFLFRNERIKKTFDKLGLSRKEVKQVIKKMGKGIQKSSLLYDAEFIKTIEEAAQQAVTNFHRQIELGDFLVAAAENDKNFRKLLFDSDLEAIDINYVISWDDFVTYEAEWNRKFWKLANLLKKPGIGKQWAAGYTVNVDKYAVDVTKLIRKRNLPLHIVGRRKEIERIERVLSRRGENNVLVIGRPGGGRSTIVYSFAKKILEGRSTSILNYRRVLELDMQAMFSGLKTPGEILERFKIVFSEAANAGNIILIIDNIHSYIGKQEGVGSFDISSALIPYLSSPNLQIVGITTFDSFHRQIETNPAVMNFFERVKIEEPSKEETIFILEDLLPGFEKQYSLKVSYKALRAVIELTDRYIQNVPFPEKAINFLGELMVYVRTETDSKIVLPKHAAQVISQ